MDIHNVVYLTLEPMKTHFRITEIIENDLRVPAYVMSTACTPILPSLVLSITDWNSSSSPMSVLIFAFLFYPFSLSAIAVIGLPLLLLATRLNLVNAWSALFAGAIGGGALHAILGPTASLLTAETLKFTAIGSASGLLFLVLASLWQRVFTPRVAAKDGL